MSGLDQSVRLSSDELLAMHSGDYVERFERRPISRLARLLPHMQLRASDRLLDLACGNAMLLELVHDRVARYCGIDFSPEFVAAAQQRALRLGAGHAEIVCADIAEYCHAHPAAFDVATAMDFTEHIYDDDFVRLFSAVHAALKPGARLYVHTPNRAYFLELMKQVGVYPQLPEHIAVRDRAQNLALLARCGFDVARMRVSYLPHYNILRLLAPLSALPLVGAYFQARLFIECIR